MRHRQLPHSSLFDNKVYRLAEKSKEISILEGRQKLGRKAPLTSSSFRLLARVSSVHPRGVKWNVVLNVVFQSMII